MVRGRREALVKTLRRRLGERFALARRKPGEAGPRTPPSYVKTFGQPWWEGEVEGQPCALSGKLGLWRFSGHVVVGARSGWPGLLYERRQKRRRAQLLRVLPDSRRAASIETPAVLDLIGGLSGAVRRLAIAVAGISCPDYGSAGFERLASDLTLLGQLLDLIQRLPDPPLLAAVKADDVSAVRARLAAGDDPNQPGPRDGAFLDVGVQRETPLLLAVARGRRELVRLLTAHASLDTASGWDVARVATRRKDARVLETLLDASGGRLFAGIWIEALRMAVSLDWTEGVRLLLEAGTDPRPVSLPTSGVAPEIRSMLEKARAEVTTTPGPIGDAARLEGGTLRRCLSALRRLVHAASGVERAWEEAARELGLAYAGGMISGDSRGHAVRIEITPGSPTLTRISVDGVPEWLQIRRESLREKLGLTGERFIVPSAETQWMKTNDVVTRDGEFDRRIDLRGPIADCLALASQVMRRRLLAFVDKLEGRVLGGKVEIERPGRLRDTRRLVALATASIEMAHAIATQVARGPLTCLSENATRDPSESVRAAMLSALGERFPRTPATIEASRLAIRSGSYDWYRMEGAAQLDEEGTVFYQATLADTSLSASVRGMALRHLGWRGGPQAEDLVLSYLQAPEPEIVLHAIRILGERTGTARSVAPLQKLTGTVALDETSRAAQRAIDEIQGRLQNAAPGQLSLAGEEQQGELSLTDETGRVSLAARVKSGEPPDGQL